MAVAQPVFAPTVRRITFVRDHQRLALAASIGILIVLIALSLPAYPLLTSFRAEALQTLPNVLAPLVVLALFIERAVEVVLSAWRADGAQKLREEARRAREIGTAEEQRAAHIACDRYGVESKKIAFLIGFVLALLISMMGVRAIEMLVGNDVVPGTPLSQQKLFVRVDVMMTALLLAGGAEGIHKVVHAFTTFIDRTQRHLSQAELEAPYREVAVAPASGVRLAGADASSSGEAG